MDTAMCLAKSSIAIEKRRIESREEFVFAIISIEPIWEYVDLKT